MESEDDHDPGAGGKMLGSAAQGGSPLKKITACEGRMEHRFDTKVAQAHGTGESSPHHIALGQWPHVQSIEA